jgi:hypothetical protein
MADDVISSLDVARQWVRDVFYDRDLSAAWGLTDPDAKLATVQSWMLESGEEPDDERAAHLLELLDRGDADMFAALAPVFFSHFARWEGFDARSVAAPEIVGVDLEVVRFLDREQGVVEAGELVSMMSIVLRYRDGEWRVAGITDLAVPGWPPSSAPIDRGAFTMHPSTS